MITNLIPDALICIFQHLQHEKKPCIRDLTNVMRVCKLFHKIASSNILWKGIASTFKIPIHDQFSVKSQVATFALRMKKIAQIIEPLKKKNQLFPYEDAWSMLCAGPCSSEEQRKAAEIGLTHLTNKISEFSDDDLIHVIWRQILRHFEMGMIAQAAVRTIIRELYLSKKNHLINYCIDLAVVSPAACSIACCLNELYTFNPLLIFNNPTIEDTLTTLFESAHQNKKVQVLKKYIEFGGLPTTDSTSEELISVVYMYVAKEIMNKAACYPDPESMLSTLSASEFPPSDAFRSLYAIYISEYKQLSKKQLESQISKVISSLSSLTLK